MPNQARFTQNVNNPLLKTINSTSQLMEFPTSTNRHLDVNIASGDAGHGLATEAKQDDQITKLTEIDTAIDSIDGKISKGSDDSITGDLQQNLVYGRFDGDGTLKAVRTSSDGSLIVDPSEDSIITADGVTQEQRVMICGNHGGNLRTVKVGENGAVNTEVDHSWDNTNVLINNVTLAAAASTTSIEFDLGQGVSHEIGRLEIFVDNSAGVELEVIGAARHTSAGTDYFPRDAPSVISSEEAFTFAQDDVGLSAGHRFMLFDVTNNDGLTSTDVTLRVAYYK